jgi:hypothetical protein
MGIVMTSRYGVVALAAILALPSLAKAQSERYSVIFGGTNVGHLIAETKGDQTSIDFDYKNNGRGPTMTETIRLDAGGLPW